MIQMALAGYRIPFCFERAAANGNSRPYPAAIVGGTPLGMMGMTSWCVSERLGGRDLFTPRTYRSDFTAPYESCPEIPISSCESDPDRFTSTSEGVSFAGDLNHLDR